jgi:hypothetical protein
MGEDNMSEEPKKVEIDVGGLLEELQAAGLPVASVNSDGRIDWLPGATGADKAAGAQILADHRGRSTRSDRMERAGVTLPAMIEALWEKVFLNRDDKAVQLLQKMAEVDGNE